MSVRVDISNAVAQVTLDRPEQMNAITVDLGRDLAAALREVGARADVNLIVVRGAGGNFCAGGDFHEVERLRAAGTAGLRPLFENFADACRAVAEVPIPVIAVVEGVAMAGGFEFLLAADVVLVRDDARVSDNHIRYGQVPGGGSTQRLPRLVGRQRALGVLLGGDRLDGPALVELGIAYRSWPADEFDARVDEFVATLAGRRRDAVVGIKSLVNEGLQTDLERGLALELEAVIAHISGNAGEAGVDAFSERSSS